MSRSHNTLLLLALAACLLGTAAATARNPGKGKDHGKYRASFATYLQVYSASGQYLPYDVEIHTGAWDPYDWDGVSTPGAIDGLILRPGKMGLIFHRLEGNSWASCPAFTLKLTRLDTGAASEEWRASWCDMDCRNPVTSHAFFGGEVVVAWQDPGKLCPI